MVFGMIQENYFFYTSWQYNYSSFNTIIPQQIQYEEVWLF